MAGIPWSELLRPEVCGLAGLPDADLPLWRSQAVIRLPEEIGSVLLNCYLASDAETGEPAFVIDSDFFTDAQTETAHAPSQLEAFTRQSSYFFRWCVTDRLHAALGPIPVDPTG